MTAISQSKAHRILKDWLPSIILILMMLVARSTLADHYLVPTGSMENTLLPGDHVLVNKAAYGLRLPFTNHVLVEGDTPVAGDVVIFDSPQDQTRLIKRVVAVAGDHVQLHAGRLLINGQLLGPDPLSAPEKIDSRQPSNGQLRLGQLDMGQSDVEQIGQKIVELNLSSGGGPAINGLVVPAGEVLVLGDHRGNSHDGRYFGTIPVTSIYGRASAVFWRSKGGPEWKEL